MRALDTMFGFRKEDAEQMEEAARRIPPTDLIRADYDDPETAPLAPVVCLLVATRALGGPALGYGCCCIISRRRACLGGLGWRRCGRGILCRSRRVGLGLFEGKGWL